MKRIKDFIHLVAQCLKVFYLQKFGEIDTYYSINEPNDKENSHDCKYWVQIL